MRRLPDKEGAGFPYGFEVVLRRDEMIDKRYVRGGGNAPYQKEDSSRQRFRWRRRAACEPNAR